MNPKLKAQLNKFLKRTFFIGFLFSSSAFIFLRVMIYPLPVELAEDCVIFIKTVLTGWLLVIIAKGTFEALVFVAELVQNIVESYMQSFIARINIYKNSSTIAQYYPYKRERQGTVKIYNKPVRTKTTVLVLQD
jgi:hypothetical protein